MCITTTTTAATKSSQIEQTSGYQWGDGRGRDKIGVWNSDVQITMYKIDKRPG